MKYICCHCCISVTDWRVTGQGIRWRKNRAAINLCGESEFLYLHTYIRTYVRMFSHIPMHVRTSIRIQGVEVYGDADFNVPMQ